MAFPTAVNDQITDSVTQQNVTVLANSAAMATSSIYQSAAHSISILYENAVLAQKNTSICAQAATNQGVIQIYSVNTMAGAMATSKVGRGDTASNLLILLLALRALK